MKNKGFSLVELIIVIAIMAILVGLMAPQLIKYIEKTNVSSDEQLLDSVYQALRYAIVDSEVQADDASRAIIGSWDGTGYYTLDSLEGSEALSYSSNALTIPSLIAPACPEKPPPLTLASTSNLSVIFVSSRG